MFELAMPNLRGSVAWLITVGLLSLPWTDSISDECRLHDVSKITCVCSRNKKEFFLPEGYNYENVTSVALFSCSSANLHFSSLTEASRIEEISVQNIDGRLLFELFVTSNILKNLELSNVQIVPLLTHYTFTSLSKIERFEIRNVTVANFEEQFDDIEVTELVMLNVTVRRLDGFNFSERGRSLRIIDCQFHNVATSLNFAYFSSVEIVNSTFQLLKPGHLSIDSNVTLILNSVFSNVSMNVVATSGIAINHTCADGNKQQHAVPTELFINRNNTVCIAGNCKCPKSNGGNFGRMISSSTILLQAVIALIGIASFFTDP